MLRPRLGCLECMKGYEVQSPSVRNISPMLLWSFCARPTIFWGRRLILTNIIFVDDLMNKQRCIFQNQHWSYSVRNSSSHIPNGYQNATARVACVSWPLQCKSNSKRWSEWSAERTEDAYDPTVGSSWPPDVRPPRSCALILLYLCRAGDGGGVPHPPRARLSARVSRQDQSERQRRHGDVLSER